MIDSDEILDEEYGDDIEMSDEEYFDEDDYDQDEALNFDNIERVKSMCEVLDPIYRVE